jgi:phage-related protein
MSVPIFVEFRGGLTDFVAKMGVVNGELDKMALKGAAVSSKLAFAGKAAAAGIAVVAAGVAVESIKMAGDFQQATNVLVTAAGESTKNLAMVRKGILDISTSTGTGWQGVTDGMYLLEKAGYRAADALMVEKAAAQAAREEGADLSTVTQAATSIMASYHLKATDAVMVMNQMKTAAGESKTTMESFAGSLSTVLPVASANKIAFADVAGALATLTQHGTSADEATQELSNTIRNLAAPNAVAVKEMAQLGISAQDVSKNLGEKGVTGTLNYLSETVLSKMGPSGKLLLDTFYQSKAAGQDLTAMLAKMPPQARELAQAYHDGTITVKDYRAEIKSLPTDQYAVASQFANLQNTANGFNTAIRQGLPGTQTYTEAIKKMTGGANGLNTTLQITGESTEATAERVKRIADAAKGASKDVQGWDSTQKLLNVRLDMWKQAIEAAAITLGMKLIPYVVKLMDWLQTSLVPLVHKLASEAMPKLKQAFADISAEFDKNRVGLAKLWDGMQKLWQIIRGPLGQALVAVLVVALVTVVTTIDGLLTALAFLGNHLKQIEAAVKTVSATLKRVFVDAVNAVKTAIDAVVKVVQGLPDRIRSAIPNAGKILEHIGQDIIDGLVKGITSKFDAVKNKLGDLTNLIPSWKGPPEKDSTLLYSAGTSIIKGLVRGIADSFSTVKSVLTNLTVFIGGALHQSNDSPLAQQIEKDTAKLKAAATHRDTVVKQLADAQQNLKSLQDSQANLVQSVTDSAEGYGSISAVDGDGSLSADDIATQMQQRLDQITGFRSQIDNLKTQGINSTTLQDIISAGVDKGGQMATAIQAGGSAAVTQLNNIQATINAQAVSLGKSAGDNMYAAGIQAAQGLVDGLTAQESVLNGTMKWLAAQMVQALQDATTPSRDPGANKGANDPGAGTRTKGSSGGGGDVHVHVQGMYGDVKEAAQDVRNALLDMKKSGQLTAIGLT